MDRKIEKKGITLKRLIPILLILIVVLYLAYQLISRSGTTRYNVPDSSRLTTAKVEYGEFRDYYPFDGEVVPVTVVYLDVEQGGRVEEIFAEDGKPIKKGDPILRFSNPAFQRGLITSENALLDSLDTYQNTQLNLAQSKTQREETLLQLKYNLTTLERKYERYRILKKEKIVISEEEYQQLIDDLEYNKAKLKLKIESNKREDLLSERQLEKAERAIERISKGLELLAKQMDSLELKAPISGQLSSIKAEVGQNIGPGVNLGHIDVLDKLKISAGIPQFYNSKVRVGTKGKFSLDGEKYEVEVTKVYPEIINDQFKVDLVFAGSPPAGIKRGQTLTIELSFSEPGRSLMVKKGGFYQETSGRWVYLISKDGKTAHKTPMRLGRNNPRYLEVLEGLDEGDWIITSGYDIFNEADELIFDEAIE